MRTAQHSSEQQQRSHECMPPRTDSSMTTRTQPQQHAAASSPNMIAQIYSKINAADKALDAHIQAHSPRQTSHAHRAPHSPGLSPIAQHSHTPFATKVALVDEQQQQHTQAQRLCDHSLHSLRPTGVHAVLDSSVTSTGSSMQSSPLGAVAPATRPSDLYGGSEADRAKFFEIMQRLWSDQQMQTAAERAKREAERSQQPSATEDDSKPVLLTARVISGHMPLSTTHGPIRARSVTRHSIASTVASSPSSAGSSPASAKVSVASGTSSDTRSSRSSSSSRSKTDPSFALWESQILNWESRLCNWKNNQETLLASRVRELEEVRTTMEAQMSAQEQIYAARTSKIAQAKADLERERKALAEAKSENTKREEQVRALLATRTSELEKREIKVARMKKELAAQGDTTVSSGLSSIAASASSQALLQQLTQQLSASFSAKEKALSDAYALKSKKLCDELAGLKVRETQVHEMQALWTSKIGQIESEDKRRAEEMDATLKQRSDKLEAEFATKVSKASADRIAEMQSAHKSAMAEAESKRDALVGEIAALRSSIAASAAAEEAKSLEMQRSLKQAHETVAALQSQLQLKSVATPSTSVSVTSADQLFSAELQSRLTAQFDSELSSLKRMHSAELAAMTTEHRTVVSGLQSSLETAQACEASAQLELVQLRSKLAETESALAAAVAQLPPPPAARVSIGTGTDPAADPAFAGLAGDLAATQTLLAQKSAVVAALQEELASTHRAHEDDLLRAMAAAKHTEAQLVARAAEDLSAAKADAAALLASTLKERSEALQALRDDYARREQAWTESNQSAEEVSALLRHREELSRRCTTDLESREAALAADRAEFDARCMQLESERASMIATFEARLEEHMHMVRTQEEAFQLREAALAERHSKLESLEADREALDAKRTEFEAKAAAQNASYAAGLKTLTESQGSLDASFKALRASQAALKADTESMQTEAASIKADREALDAALKDAAARQIDLEAWTAHVSTRDAELTAAIAAFEAHMAAREAATAEWSARLATVETRYSVEFVRVSEECVRLQRWEDDLEARSQELHERQCHLEVMQRNLGEYLSPFEESTLAAGNRSMMALEGANHSPVKHQRTPNKPLRPQQPLQMINGSSPSATAVSARIRPSPFRFATTSLAPPGTISKLAAAAPSSSVSPSPSSPPPAAAPVASAASVPSSSSSLLYSPTQADISFQLTDQNETSFAQDE